MKRIICLIALMGMVQWSQAQQHPLAKEMFKLINEARTQPQAFLQKHSTKIKQYNTRYAEYLKIAQPIGKVQWDAGLEKMAISAIEKDDQNPKYKGANKICGGGQGMRGGSLSKDAMFYVADFYTNVHNPDNLFFGCYINKATSGYHFAWGLSCDRQKLPYKAQTEIDSSKVDFQALNTAVGESYLRESEKRMMLELNFVRAYPKVYAQIIADHLEQEANSIFGLDFEEKLAGEELIKELEQMTPLTILQPAECIFEAAKVHGEDCKKRGYFAHMGSDRSHPWDRILKHCPSFSTGNENGAGSSNPSPRAAVISLLMDDGITSRGHRKNILDPAWTHAACYYYADTFYGNQWVQNFGHQ